MMALAALVCFAANSLLCRYALGDGSIDAATFTSVRLLSGAIILTALMRPRGRVRVVPVLALFAYASSFSFAYDHVSAATGALLLFGAVQVTMLAGAVFVGERLSIRQIAGLVVAVSGLVYLLSPGLEAPPVVGTAFMLAAGLAWGIYSLQGQSAAVALHFIVAVPPALLVNVVRFSDAHVTVPGLAAAVISGAVTSGLGYAIWFRALKSLSTTAASTLQLAVPVLAAFGGTWLLSEPLTLRLVVASCLVLIGIALTLPMPVGARLGVGLGAWSAWLRQPAGPGRVSRR